MELFINPSLSVQINTGDIVITYYYEGFQQDQISELSLQIISTITRGMKEKDAQEILVKKSGASETKIENTLSRLLERGIILSRKGDEEKERWSAYNWEEALIYISQRDCRKAIKQGHHPSRKNKTSKQANTDCLPSVNAVSEPELIDALTDRRTCRDFYGEEVQEAVIAKILKTAFESDSGSSSGERSSETFPIEKHLIPIRCNSLPPKSFIYRVQDHSIESDYDTTTVNDKAIKDLLAKQSHASGVAFLVIFSVKLEVGTDDREEPAKMKSTIQRIGWRAQRLLLAATSLGLQTFQSGAIDKDAAAELLSIDTDRVLPTYVVAIGHGEKGGTPMYNAHEIGN